MEETVIKNLEIYNIRMDKSIEDKLWFLGQPEIKDVDVFVDFGCANGNMLRHMYYQDPGKVYIGYDNNTEMLSIAREYCKNTGIKFIYNFENIREYINREYPGKKVCLILSSVLHEVYSYTPAGAGIDEFWENIKEDLNPDYIVIRDMTWGFNHEKYSYRQEQAKHLDCCYKISRLANQDQIKDFERVIGRKLISNLRDVTHFLLKYKYVENWNREVQENYLSYEVMDVVSELRDKYKLTYHKFYCLPYLHEQFMKDFDIDFIGNTHYNFLFKKL